jgi:CheY-like chemotaxis protein
MEYSNRILVIDGAEDHLLICRLILEHRGFNVLPMQGIDTLDELFETIYSFRPDVIFTDQQMPGIDGEQIIRLLKKAPRFKNIPIIYISAAKRLEKLACSAGADGYLAKPFKVNELLNILTKYTGYST